MFSRVREKFGDLRWIPLEPEFLDYPNAQFLMIGEAQNELGKAAISEGHKEPHEQEPGQEIEKLEQENETRVESLQGKTGHRASTEFTVKFTLFLRRSNHLPGSWPGSPKVSFGPNHLGQYLLLNVDFSSKTFFNNMAFFRLKLLEYIQRLRR